MIKRIDFYLFLYSNMAQVVEILLVEDECVYQ